MSITNYVSGRRYTGITSSAPLVVYDIPLGTMIRIWPTSAGTANVYSTGSPANLAALDTTNANITSNTNARWTAWSAGAVVAETVQSAQMNQTAIAVVVTSGTWSVEVSS